MYCENCGCKNEDDARFCYNCGQALMTEVTVGLTPPQPPKKKNPLGLVLGIISIAVIIGVIVLIISCINGTNSNSGTNESYIASFSNDKNIVGEWYGQYSSFVFYDDETGIYNDNGENYSLTWYYDNDNVLINYTAQGVEFNLTAEFMDFGGILVDGSNWFPEYYKKSGSDANTKNGVVGAYKGEGRSLLVLFDDGSASYYFSFLSTYKYYGYYYDDEILFDDLGYSLYFEDLEDGRLYVTADSSSWNAEYFTKC